MAGPAFPPSPDDGAFRETEASAEIAYAGGRLCGDRIRQRRGSGCGTALRGSGRLGAAAGGRPLRSEPDPPPARCRALCVQRSPVQLELRERARTPPERPAGQAAAGTGAGRIVKHQRAGVSARPCPRLRRMGGGGCDGVELRRRLALFSEDRGQGGPFEPLPGRSRAGPRLHRAAPQPDLARVHRGEPGGGLHVQRGRQRLPAGRLRLVPDERGRRAALERGESLPVRRAPPGEPRRAMRLPRGADRACR